MELPQRLHADIEGAPGRRRHRRRALQHQPEVEGGPVEEALAVEPGDRRVRAIETEVTLQPLDLGKATVDRRPHRPWIGVRQGDRGRGPERGPLPGDDGRSRRH
jgi:hypothetical protein